MNKQYSGGNFRRQAQLGVNLAKQSGVTLAVSLVLLLAITIIGVSALTTTSLEERMAGNIQELNRAFQTAESGLNQAFANSADFSLAQTVTSTVTNTNAYAEANTDFKQFTKPRRGSGWSAKEFSSAHFETQSTGTTNSGAVATVHQGAYQIMPKLEN
ncbi:MAG: pilus assembly PilX N-terminal domain-containing protein [Gammaproteobacteria bacterium]|nr:pilus assembly PilX N-terminal domain-containing protein [Gammaproteobacteria bacterium]